MAPRRPPGRTGDHSGGTEITSLTNPLVAATRKLARPAERARRGQFLLEGARGIRAALDAGVRLDTLLATSAGAGGHPGLLADARRAGTRVRTVTDQVMAALTQTVTAPGLLAVAPTVTSAQPALPPDARLVCVLDQVADPGNAGTVLRAADAVGADALVTTAGSVHLENPKAARAAAGSLFHLPVLAGVAWPDLRDACRGQGLTLIGADPHAPATTDTAPLERPCALVLGNEAHGLSAQVRAEVDWLVRLPVGGRAESLNLAAAAAVLLWETARRQAATSRDHPHPRSSGLKRSGPEASGVERSGPEASGVERSGPEASGAEASGPRPPDLERSGAGSSGAEASGLESSGPEPSDQRPSPPDLEPSGAEASGVERSSAEASGAEASRAEASGAEASGPRPPGAERSDPGPSGPELPGPRPPGSRPSDRPLPHGPSGVPPGRRQR